MGKDKIVGPGLGVALLASITFASVYWTSDFIGGQENYFHKFVGAMDSAIEDAYGKTFIDRDEAR
mgnify:CR=1 FL=1